MAKPEYDFQAPWVPQWTESDTAQYPANQQIVAGELVISKNQRSRLVKQKYKKT